MLKYLITTFNADTIIHMLIVTDSLWELHNITIYYYIVTNRTPCMHDASIVHTLMLTVTIGDPSDLNKTVILMSSRVRFVTSAWQ